MMIPGLKMLSIIVVEMKITVVLIFNVNMLVIIIFKNLK